MVCHAKVRIRVGVRVRVGVGHDRPLSISVDHAQPQSIMVVLSSMPYFQSVGCFHSTLVDQTADHSRPLSIDRPSVVNHG